jgi:hypothetical protein
MTSRHPSPNEAPGQEHDSAGIVDWSRVRDYAALALRAVRRHPIAAALSFVAVAALGPLTLATMPRTYRVEATLTAGRNPVVSTLADPVLRRPFEMEDPAHVARDAILRRDNLAALVEETGLLERWARARAPMGRLRDAAVGLLGTAPTREERVEALVERLEKRLTVELPGEQPGAPPSAANGGRVRLALEWPDADTAKVLVEAAARRFFAGQREHERALAHDSLAVLATRAEGLRGEIDAKVKEVHELELGVLRGSPALSRSHRAPRGRVPQEEELARLRTTLDAKKVTLAELERLRDRRGEELRAELERARTAYSEGHPSVARTRELLARVGEPSPDVAALRTEIVGLEQDVARASERVARLVDDEDPRLEYRRAELRLLLAQHAAVRDRLDGARVESEAAEAAFERRYGFAVPPRAPKRPVWPIPALSIAAGLVGGALLALFVAAALDLRSGLVLAGWQLERLGLPVLRELRG